VKKGRKAMFKKSIFIVLPLFAATPAAAQDIIFAPGTGDSDAALAPADDYDADTEANALAERLGDPATKYGVAAAVEGVTGAIMNMPVGPLAEAIERAAPGTVDRRLPPDARVGDLAGPAGDRLPQRMAARSVEAMEIAGGFARAFAEMMPELERLGRDLEESFKKAREQAGRRY
jgi:Ni,Fe-hydrogenase I large subunit